MFSAAEDVAVSRDMDFYSEQAIITEGDYTVYWALYGKDEMTKTIRVYQ